MLATGFLTLFAMARVWAAIFWSSHPEGDGACAGRLPATMTIPLLALTLLIIAAGLAAGPLVDLALAAAAGLVDPAAYLAAVLPEAP